MKRKGQHWAVIPSRANSTRFPDKALALLCGETLIDRAIRTSREAKGIDGVIVSTNDKNLAKRLPSNIVVHWRPDEYAQNDTRIDDTLLNMIDSVPGPTYWHLIQLTSPFIHYSHVEEGIALLNKHSEADSVQLVTRVSNAQHAYSQRHVTDSGEIQFCYREERDQSYNSQRKPTRYAFAGYIGFGAVSLQKNGDIWGERSYPIIGGQECAIDIDTKEDLEFAEFYLTRKQEEARYATG